FCCTATPPPALHPLPYTTLFRSSCSRASCGPATSRCGSCPPHRTEAACAAAARSVGGRAARLTAGRPGVALGLALGLARPARPARPAAVVHVEARALERDADGLDDALDRVAGAWAAGGGGVWEALVQLEGLVRAQVPVDVDRHRSSCTPCSGSGGGDAPRPKRRRPRSMALADAECHLTPPATLDPCHTRPPHRPS